MEAPEGFRNSDEDRFSESQVIEGIWWELFCKALDVSLMLTKWKQMFPGKESSVEDAQDLRDIEMPEEQEEQEEHGEQKGDEQEGERQLIRQQRLHLLVWTRGDVKTLFFFLIFRVFDISGEDTSHDQEDHSSTTSHLATTVS